MKTKKAFKSGQEVPFSGQYLQRGPRGGDTGKEITAIKGHRFPPTDQSGQSFELSDRTKNKSGGRKRK